MLNGKTILVNGNIFSTAINGSLSEIPEGLIPSLLGFQEPVPCLELGHFCKDKLVDEYQQLINFYGVRNGHVYHRSNLHMNAQIDWMSLDSDGIFIAITKDNYDCMMNVDGTVIDYLPNSLRAEMAWKRYLTGAEYVDLPVPYFKGSDYNLKLFRYEKDDKFEQIIMDAVNYYWHNFVCPNLPKLEVSHV